MKDQAKDQAKEQAPGNRAGHRSGAGEEKLHGHLQPAREQCAPRQSGMAARIRALALPRALACASAVETARLRACEWPQEREEQVQTELAQTTREAHRS